MAKQKFKAKHDTGRRGARGTYRLRVRGNLCSPRPVRCAIYLHHFQCIQPYPTFTHPETLECVRKTDRADISKSLYRVDPRRRGAWTTTYKRSAPLSRLREQVIGKTILHMLIRTLHKTAFLYIILHNLHIYNRFTFLHSNNCFVVFIIIYSIYSPIAKYCRIFKHVF